MPFNSKKRRQKADTQIRDTHGHFIKINTGPGESVEEALKITSPLESDTKEADKSLDEPLVSLSINNPFKKVLYWLNDIRKKQITTFDFKIKVPLIALPVFIAMLGGGFNLFFNLGKQNEQKAISALPTPTPVVIIQPTATPAPVLVSRLGVIKATYQVSSFLSPTPALIPQTSPTQSLTDFPLASSTSPISLTPTPIPPSRYVLLGTGNQIIFLTTSTTLSFQPYLNKRVIATGMFDKTKNTLQISKSSDIEILQ